MCGQWQNPCVVALAVEMGCSGSSKHRPWEVGLSCLQEIHCIEVFESMQVTEYTFNQTPDVIQYGPGL